MLTIATPSKTQVNSNFMKSILTVANELPRVYGIKLDYQNLPGKSNIDQARSMLASRWYRNSNDDDLFLFIDSDHIFTTSDVIRAIELESDVACGIYPNTAGHPTCSFINLKEFTEGNDNRLRYGGTGFMLIRRPILTRIYEYLKLEGIASVRLDDGDWKDLIPFFKQRIVASETSEGKYDWYGEDYTFCWLVRKLGGVIRGFLSSTIIHEVTSLRHFYPKQWNVVANRNKTIETLSSDGKLELKSGSDIFSKLKGTDGPTGGNITSENASELSEIVIREAEDFASSHSKISKAPDLNDANELLIDGTELTDESLLDINNLYSASDSTSTSDSEVESPLRSMAQIVYYCGNSRVKFSPKNNKLGGSEQSVVYLAQAWAAKKYLVSVYGNVEEGNYDGVQYINVSKFNFDIHYRTLILWRGFGLSVIDKVKADNLLVDLHDFTNPQLLPSGENLERVNKLMVKSHWHKNLWSPLNNMKLNSKFRVVPNGLRTSILDPNSSDNLSVKREPFRLIYTSCYTRGLYQMVKYSWPIIKKNIPEAELHCYYGYDLVTDKQQLQRIKEVFQTDGVFDHGKVDAKEVTKARYQSKIHFYLCDSPTVETDCISVRESIYCGCLPVIFKNGVFKERGGIKIDYKENSTDPYLHAAVHIIKLLRSPHLFENFYTNSLPQIRQQEVSWESVADIWLTV